MSSSIFSIYISIAPGEIVFSKGCGYLNGYHLLFIRKAQNPQTPMPVSTPTAMEEVAIPAARARAKAAVLAVVCFIEITP
jgi:hypothetical protein